MQLSMEISSQSVKYLLECFRTRFARASLVNKRSSTLRASPFLRVDLRLNKQLLQLFKKVWATLDNMDQIGPLGKLGDKMTTNHNFDVTYAVLQSNSLDCIVRHENRSLLNYTNLILQYAVEIF